MPTTINAIPNGWTFWDKMNHDVSVSKFALWMSLQPSPTAVKEVEEFFGCKNEVVFTRTSKFGDTENLEKEIFSLKAKQDHNPKGLTRKEERRLYRLEEKLEKCEQVRVWEVTLPDSYQVKAGIKVLVTEKPSLAEYDRVGLYVYVSRLRRLAQKSLRGTTGIGFPFIGTFWAHLTDSKYGIRCLDTQGEFAKCTRAKGDERAFALPSI